MKAHRGHIVAIVLAVLATIPGLAIRLSGLHERMLHDPTQAPWVALCAGVAVLGASFLLLWACDALQEDLSQTLVLAIVALIAVLPEYAVDMYYTWMAGKQPEQYAHLAIANMTGANRLLIGVAWSVIAVIFWFKSRRDVILQRERRTELFFLGLATLVAFTVPLVGSITWVHGVLFIGIYIWYIAVAGTRPVTESEAEGPAEFILGLPARARRITTASMILFAAGAILANAEPFSEGLIATGRAFHINEFLLVQWLAPIASEAPEFTVAIMFALRGHAGLALGSLLSSKLNQWTLLVGMIPAVYAVSHGTLVHPIPMEYRQLMEVMLTAAQSLLGLVLLLTLRLTLGQGLLLFVLFMGQLLLPNIMHSLTPPPPSFVGPQHIAEWRSYVESLIHPLFAIIYIVTAIGFVLDNPQRFRDLLSGAKPDRAPTPDESLDKDLESASEP
jgi:cation:H+ antiporter